jgi:hypothetical protein
MTAINQLVRSSFGLAYFIAIQGERLYHIAGPKKSDVRAVCRGDRVLIASLVW